MKELLEGRRRQVFAVYTQKHDVTARLQRILSNEGIHTAVLRASVDTSKREAWYARQVKDGVQVVICLPSLPSSNPVTKVNGCRPFLLRMRCGATLCSYTAVSSIAIVVREGDSCLRRGSGLSQIPDHEVGYFVHKLFCFFVGEDVRAAQDRSVCQRLHCCHADEGCDIEIGNIDLISMRVEIASNECINVLVDRLDIFESANTRDLFGKDAMKLGIDAMSVDCDRNEFAHRHLDRARGYLDERVAHQLQHFVRMALTDGSNQRLLARKILVERANTDAGRGSDPVGAGSIIAFSY
jgi:hypothetical protein